MDKVTVIMSFENETRNTVRFKEDVEVGALPVSGKIYVRHDVLELLGSPRKLKITIEEA